MMEISKNNLFKRGTESDITYIKVSGDVPEIFYVLEAMAPTKQKHAKELAKCFLRNFQN